VANCSSVTGMRAFLGEEADHREVDYFQGLEQFHEQGLPYQLPAAERDKLQDHPILSELQQNLRILKLEGAPSSAVNEAKTQLFTYRAALERETLRQYQKQWIQDRRVWKILSRGKERAKDVCRNDLFQHLCLLRPERGRLATMMNSEEPLSLADSWQAIRDMQSLITQDFTVLYLPGHEPVEGACPVSQCQLDLER
jgi:hypothetical protein